MRAPFDLLPLALCGLATIVAVAIVVVLSDFVRRFVLFMISVLIPVEPRAASETGLETRRSGDAGEDPGRNVLPG